MEELFANHMREWEDEHTERRHLRGKEEECEGITEQPKCPSFIQNSQKTINNTYYTVMTCGVSEVDVEGLRGD